MVEATILFNPDASEVQAELKDFVKVKLYTDRDKEPYLTNKRLMQETYDSNVLPTYVFLTPDGREIERLPRTLQVIPSEQDFVQALRRTRMATLSSDAGDPSR